MCSQPSHSQNNNFHPPPYEPKDSPCLWEHGEHFTSGWNALFGSGEHFSGTWPTFLADFFFFVWEKGFKVEYLAKELSVANKTIINRKPYALPSKRNLNIRNSIIISWDNWKKHRISPTSTWIFFSRISKMFEPMLCCPPGFYSLASFYMLLGNFPDLYFRSHCFSSRVVTLLVGRLDGPISEKWTFEIQYLTK